jgi:hypothetical protein
MSPLESLKAGFRRACVRRLVGDEEGAVDVLKNEIPKLVVTWAKTGSLEASEKKAKLKELFDDESARAEELSTAFDLFAGRFEARVAQLVREEVSSLADRFEQLMDGVKQALETPQRKVEILQSSVKSDNQSLESDQKIVLSQDPLIADAINSGSNEDEHSVTEEKKLIESIPDPIQPFEKDSINEQTVLVQDKENKELPSVGIGLRFDEIEEMIDEILSF